MVFDGWKDGGMRETSAVRGGVTVIYSRLAEKADAVIKRIISSDRREWIVVSSDREIADHAWATGSVPIAAEEFLLFLGKDRGEDEGDDNREEDRGDDEETDVTRKGNPHRLSKKEKAVRRVIAKL